VGDFDQKSNWKTHIDTPALGDVAQSESANKVWQTLVDQRGRPAAADLYEMLCGYNADQIGKTPEQMKLGDSPIDRSAGERQPRLPCAGGAGFGEATNKRLLQDRPRTDGTHPRRPGVAPSP